MIGPIFEDEDRQANNEEAIERFSISKKSKTYSQSKWLGLYDGSWPIWWLLNETKN